MGEFSKLINILNEAEKTIESQNTLVEGRADDLIKQSFDSIDNIVSKLDSEELIEAVRKVVYTYTSRWKRTKGMIKDYPNKWKYFVADTLRQSLFKAIYNAGVEDPKLLRKIKIDWIVGDDAVDIVGVVATFNHYSGIEYEGIMNFDPNQHPNDYKIELRKIEREWKELQNEWVPVTGDETLVLDLGKYKWFDLGKGACRDEGSAMGHCGNVPSVRGGDTIYSLRQVKNMGGEEYHRPSLTFIANHGILGEMKGRANEKPNEKYHPYIIELLKSKYVTGFKGGGYMPENNFHPDDLTDEQRQEVIDVKGEDFLDFSSFAVLKKIMKKFNAGEISGDVAASQANETLEELEEDGEIERFFEITGVDEHGRFLVDVSDIVEAANGLIKFVDGEEFLDVFTGHTEFDMLYKELSTEEQKKVLQHLMGSSEEIAELLGMDEDEIDEDTIEENFKEIIQSDVTDDISDIESMFRRADDDALRSGIEGEIISDIESFFNDQDLPLDFPDNIFDIIDSKNQSVPITANDLESYGHALVDYELTDIELPHRGYDEYDHEGLHEMLIDAIGEIIDLK